MRRKLTLNRETIRSLTPVELRTLAGAASEIDCKPIGDPTDDAQCLETETCPYPAGPCNYITVFPNCI